MSNGAIKISIKFFEEVKLFPKDEKGKIKAPELYKKKVLHEIESILEGGSDANELADIMDEYTATHPNPEEVYMPIDILNYFNINLKKAPVTKDPDNILERGKFYYHPALQEAPSAPILEIQPDGTFKASYEEEEFFLEIKSRYTIEDLLNYFYNRMDVENSRTKDRDLGAFKHLLKSYDIDELLYTIDQARFVSEDIGKDIPRNVFDIRDYIEDGVAILEDRKNTLFMEGLDRVIPR